MRADGRVAFDGMKVPRRTCSQAGRWVPALQWQLNQTRLGLRGPRWASPGERWISHQVTPTSARQFGKPIGQHQMVQAQIAEMVVEHKRARCRHRAAWLKDQGKPSQ